MLRQSASLARQREALPAFGLLENASIQEKQHKERRPRLLCSSAYWYVHTWRGGFKGCQAFALAEEKLLKRCIQKTYKKSDLLGGLGFHSTP